MTTETASRPGNDPGATRVEKRRRYSSQVAGVLAAAFAVSALYALISTLIGDTNSGSNLRNPQLWVFYVIGFGLAVLVRTDRMWAWRVVGVAVLVLILVGIFYYPTVFVPGAQTTLGWFENDVYVGLLILAEYLCVQRLRNIILTPGR